MKTKYFLIIFLLISYSLSVHADTLSFKNFDEFIIYKKNEQGYINNANNHQINVAHRLIIKTSNKFSKKKLARTHKAITEVKELYQGKKFTYYLAEINKDTDLQDVMSKLLKNNDLFLVQADILQQSEKSHDSNEHKKPVKNNLPRKPINKLQRQANREKQIVNALPRYLKLVGVEKLWEKTKGKGVKIAVIDDGFDLKHQEFDNLNLAFSYDASEKTLTSNPQQPIDTHGTKVAGVIFAQHDNKGVEGIAPEAEFIAIRQPDTWTSNTLLSFQMAKLNDADIINCSWNSPVLMQPIADAINDLAEYGRDGKGTAVIIAAGNKGKYLRENDTEASIDSAIVVGASNMMGKTSLKYSNTGESIDLLSLGNPVQSTLPNNKFGQFAKTSLASSIVSGISALILAQNPEYNLTQLESGVRKLILDVKRPNRLNNNLRNIKREGKINVNKRDSGKKEAH